MFILIPCAIMYGILFKRRMLAKIFVISVFACVFVALVTMLIIVFIFAASYSPKPLIIALGTGAIILLAISLAGYAFKKQ